MTFAGGTGPLGPRGALVAASAAAASGAWAAGQGPWLVGAWTSRACQAMCSGTKAARCC